MTCTKCDRDIAECECPDAIERIENILEPNPYLFIGPDYRRRRGATQERSE